MKTLLLSVLMLLGLFSIASATTVSIINVSRTGTLSVLGGPVNLTGNANLPAIYSGKLLIYLNPTGYYEYILSQNGETLPTILYAGISPDSSPVPIINVTKISNQSINSSYVASIFYSSLIDITPLENQETGTGIYPYNFSYFVQENQVSFSNTTLVFKHNLNLSSPAGLFALVKAYATTLYLTSIGFLGFVTSGQTVGQYLTGEQVSLGGVYISAFVPASTAIPVTLNLLNQETYQPSASRFELFPGNYIAPVINSSSSLTPLAFPLNVSFAYSGTFGLVIGNGVSGMYNFNDYVDNVYAPSIVQSEFLNIDMLNIFVILIIVFMVKKMSGGN